MRRVLPVLLLSLCATARAETVAIVGGTVHPVSGTPIENATVLVEDGRIAVVGTGLAVPADARVIDARGRIVTPGLMNAATQLALVEVSSATDTADQGVTSGPLGAAFDVQYAVNPNSTLLPLARADGLTRAAVLPTSTAGAPFSGRAAVLTLRTGHDIVARTRAAMVATTGGWDADGDGIGGSRAAQWLLLRNGLDEAAHFSEHRRAYRTAAGRDQLLRRPDVEALTGVLDGSLPLVIEATRESDIRQAVRLADDYRLRIVVSGGAEAWRAADLLAARGIPVILDPTDNLPRTFDAVGARLDNAALLQRAGVVLAFAVEGIHASHNAGMALRALTVNPARIWGIDERYGTLERGKDADLVVWDGDPLEPSTRAVAVLVEGREVPLETRQARLADRYHPRHRDSGLPPAYRH